jgi:hypothetical protein
VLQLFALGQDARQAREVVPVVHAFELSQDLSECFLIVRVQCVLLTATIN